MSVDGAVAARAQSSALPPHATLLERAFGDISGGAAAARSDGVWYGRGIVRLRDRVLRGDPSSIATVVQQLQDAELLPRAPSEGCVLLPDAAAAAFFLPLLEAAGAPLVLLGSVLRHVRRGRKLAPARVALDDEFRCTVPEGAASPPPRPARAGLREWRALRARALAPAGAVVIDDEHLLPTMPAAASASDDEGGAAAGRRARSAVLAAAALSAVESLPPVLLVVAGAAEARMAAAAGVRWCFADALCTSTWLRPRPGPGTDGMKGLTRQLRSALDAATAPREPAPAGAAAATPLELPARRRRDVYDPHVSLPRARALLRTGQLVAGRLRVRPHDPTVCEVELRGGAGVALVVGRDAANRSIDGDDVALQLLPRAQWLRDPDARRLRPQPKAVAPEDEEDDGDGDGDSDGGVDVASAGVDVGGDGDVRATGRVVCILKRRRAACVATVTSAAAAVAVPMDRVLPKLRLRGCDAAALLGKRLVVAIDGWDADSRLPAAHYTRVLGEVGDAEAEAAALLIESGAETHTRPFPPAALACLPPLGIAPPFGKCEGDAARRDLRDVDGLFVCSVDPVGCTDIDDTLSARRLPNGQLEVGVHIADVTALLDAGCALDREAAQRATTIYLEDRRLDMLPPVLSADLCSMRAGVPRRAVSVIWRFDDGGGDDDDDDWVSRPASVWVGRTMVRSAAAMTYTQAERLLEGRHAGEDLPSGRARDDDADDGAEAVGGAPSVDAHPCGSRVPEELEPPLRASLQQLRRVARALRRSRQAAGALELASVELQFARGDGGDIVDVKRKAPAEIHGVVAELMIAANSAVAAFTVAAFPRSALLRRHGEGRGDAGAHDAAWRAIEQLTARCGLPLPPPGERRSFAAVVNMIADAANSGPGEAGASALSPHVALALSTLLTRRLAEAEYVGSGADEGGEGGAGRAVTHVGLGLKLYTHFTSPIRRYADVIVHRLAIAAAEQQQRARDARAAEATGAPAPPRPAGVAMPASVLPSVRELARAVRPHAAQQVGAGVDDESAVDGDVETTDNAGTSSPTPAVAPPVVASPLDAAELEAACTQLNLQTRVAKAASRASAELHLALFFARRPRAAKAVVLHLRDNGFIASVPEFDLRGPVFLEARAGGRGRAAAGGAAQARGSGAGDGGDDESFALSEVVHDPAAGVLRARSRHGGSGGALEFRPLDVVDVVLSCAFEPESARVPPVRIDLALDAAAARGAAASARASRLPPPAGDAARADVPGAARAASGGSGAAAAADVVGGATGVHGALEAAADARSAATTYEDVLEAEERGGGAPAHRGLGAVSAQLRAPEARRHARWRVAARQ